MPIEIETFTTEVDLVDDAGRLSAEQTEQLIVEVLRRLEQQQRVQQRAERNSALGRRSLSLWDR